MLELNKEYTYKEICEELGWKVSDGNSKKAQIREIESAFKFFHPENKKTHKPKKSYIFTEMLRELQKPSVKNNGGCHNDKNISPMMEYLRVIFSDERLHEQPFTMTNLFCNVLKFMRKSCYEKGYAEDDELLNYCQRHYIYNPNLFKAYSATIKKVLKEITLNAITALGREKSCEYEDGYIFYYKMAKSDDRILGNIFSDYINDEVIEVERKICEEFNEKHNLSSKMKGRQLLRKIYASKALREQFDREKCAELMKHEDAIRDLNGVIEEPYQFSFSIQYIDEDRPLISYYRAVSINDMEKLTLTDNEVWNLAKKICHIVVNKSRKSFFQDKRNRKYDTFEDMQDMVVTEHLLFKNGLLDGLVNENGDYDLVVLDENGKPELWTENWGLPDVMGF